MIPSHIYSSKNDIASSTPHRVGIPVTLEEITMLLNAMEFFISESCPPRYGGNEFTTKEWEIIFGRLQNIKKELTPELLNP